MLGLPSEIRASLFDLDGVLTKTGPLHAAAWQEMFDEFLRARAAATGGDFIPFDPVRDYDEYISGRLRQDGVRTFLATRGIELPVGDSSDPARAETIHGLGNRKNELVLSLIRGGAVETYPGAVQYASATRDAGLRTAVVSASKNTREVLTSTGIDGLFEEVVDGLVAEQEGLRGKPAPDTFLAAANRLGVPAAEAAVFEDALAGVEAGRAGRFGYVVGVDSAGLGEALREHGADVVVADLAELLEQR
jgi:beta-phosphoglucomutase family hydrolase